MTSNLATSRRAAVDAFLERNRQVLAAGRGRGRLIFALDATQSRQPTWDVACQIQGEMFQAVGAIGLDIQLIYFRGLNECRASQWVSNGKILADRMSRIDCRTGKTQIDKVLSHALRECEQQKVHALAFVGDAMEESIDQLCKIAGELGMRGIRVFLFQEGVDAAATSAFREIARLTKGAHCHFSPGAPQELAELLRAVAAYAAGGLKALSASQSAGAVKLLQQLK